MLIVIRTFPGKAKAPVLEAVSKWLASEPCLLPIFQTLTVINGILKEEGLLIKMNRIPMPGTKERADDEF